MNDIWPQLAAKRIDLAEEQEFAVGGMRVCPAELTAEMNGERVELQPRVMQVLVALAQARPSVVSRERLVEYCWEGGIVTDDALNRCIMALRHIAQRFAPPPFTIETLPRVGHRLVEHAGESPAQTAPKQVRSWKVAGLAALLLLVSVGGLLLWQQRAARAEPASIAVLPFRNLSAGDPYFAQGLSEEILAQLAREPQFRVAGSTSSAQLGANPNVREAARLLNVDYLVEGSVRRQGDQVRVNADLLRVKDGVRMWSDGYSGKLDNILAIQSAIGEAVATGLKRKLVYAAAQVSRPMNGEAYALYLNARGLLRSGIPDGAKDAITLLNRAIALDPKFASAWSSLAEAQMLDGRTKDIEGMIGLVPQANSAARRALQLDPNNAQAHAHLSALIGSDSPQGIAERLHASQLGGATGEAQLWRAGALQASGRWGDAMDALRRARELDPSWQLPSLWMLDQAAVMGDRAGAEGVIKRDLASDPILQSYALARLAWFTGDFSEAARRWSSLAGGASRWSSPSKVSLESILLKLKLSNQLPSRPPRPQIGQTRSIPVGVRMAAPPSAEEWRKRNRSSAAELVYRDENVVAAKLMLNAGRAKELVATYDSPVGLLGLRRGQRVGTCFLQSAAIIAVALQAVGRAEEANSILEQADATIQAAYRRGSVPLWFEDDAAGIWALQGKRDAAVDALDRALRRGSAHATRTDLANLADEPALRSLRRYPRFQPVIAKYAAHDAKERLETARALNMRVS